MSKKFNISKEFLVEEYMNKGKSTREIAKILKCSPSTIKNHLKKYNIKKKSTTKNLSKKVLIEEYINNKKSIREVAKIIGCNHSTITNYLKKYNIEIRPNNREKQTIESVKKQFTKKGYTLTSTEYIDVKQKLEYICPIGHTGSITWSNWKRGDRCDQCYRESRRIKHIIIKGIEGKHCGECKEWKPLNCFSKKTSSWDNFANTCKECMKPHSSLQKRKRRVMKLNAISENADLKEIQFYYDVRSEANKILGEIYFHVDHIQPLTKGGLDHQDNLQILPAFINHQKSNKWPLTPEEQIKYAGYRHENN